MKKLFLLAIFACFTYFGTQAQTTPGKSAYGHSHKKAKKTKKAKKPYAVKSTTAAQRKAINVQHKTSLKTIQDNDALTNQQQRDQIKQANASHKQGMRTATLSKSNGKKK